MSSKATISKSAAAAASKPLKSKSTVHPKSEKSKSIKKSRLPDTSDEESGLLAATPSLKKSSSNKLPSLSEEDFVFFKLVKDGDINGLKDFIASELFSTIAINKTDRLGYSALHYAVKCQEEEIVTLLLSQKDILIFDTLLYAIQEENIAITKELLEYKDAQPHTALEPIYNSYSRRFVDPTESQKQKISHFQDLSQGAKGSRWNESLTTSLAATALNVAMSKPRLSLNKYNQDFEDFDSEFPDYMTSLMKSAQMGNEELMELFYARGEQLENTSDKHHNYGCPCPICNKNDPNYSQWQLVDLFDALTNPKYIYFSSLKEKMDPINYAIKKIERCKYLAENDGLPLAEKYKEFITRLEDFIKDYLNLCRTTEEAEMFLMAPNPLKGKFLPKKYPRLLTAVGLHLVDVVAHPNAQAIVYNQWAVSTWPEWDTFGLIRMFSELILRTLFLPFIAIFLWCGTEGPGDWGRKMTSPVSRFLNWIASYLIFLALLWAQGVLPQRCNNYPDVIPYSVNEGDCNERGPPNVGTEWPIFLFVFGSYISMIQRHAIPWFWSAAWNWYDLITQLLFTATFICWISAWFIFHPREEERELWNQYDPEVLAESFLSLALIFAFGRTFRIILLNPVIGPFQISLGRTVKSFFSSTLSYPIILIAFGLGLNAIYIPYNKLKGVDATSKQSEIQDTPFGSVLKAPEELFWALFGMSGNDRVSIVGFTSPLDSKIIRHHYLNEVAGKVLFAAFHVIGVTMMFNLLVGSFSAAGDLENEDAEWKFARTQVYMTYMKDTTLPPPFNLIPTRRGILRFCEYMGLLCVGNGASCSLKQCCFIVEPIDKKFDKETREKYSELIYLLTHRYKKQIADEENESPATHDDVKEISEELAELKSQLESKLRELEKPSTSSEELNILQPPSITNAAAAAISALSNKSGSKFSTLASNILSNRRIKTSAKNSKGMITSLRLIGKSTVIFRRKSSLTMTTASSAGGRTLGQASILSQSTKVPFNELPITPPKWSKSGAAQGQPSSTAIVPPPPSISSQGKVQPSRTGLETSQGSGKLPPPITSSIPVSQRSIQKTIPPTPPPLPSTKTSSSKVDIKTISTTSSGPPTPSKSKTTGSTKTIPPPTPPAKASSTTNPLRVDIKSKPSTTAKESQKSSASKIPPPPPPAPSTTNTPKRIDSKPPPPPPISGSSSAMIQNTVKTSSTSKNIQKDPSTSGQ